MSQELTPVEMKREYTPYSRILPCILFFYSAFAAGNLQAQTANGLTGNKTGNLVQSGSLIGLGTGNATVSSPMSAHTTGVFNTLRFYYGDAILNTSASSPSTIRASRVLTIGGVLGSGADAYIQFRNASNATIASGTTTYIKIGSAPSITGLSASVGGLLGLTSVYSITGYGYTGAGNYVLGSSYNENGGSLAGTTGGTTTDLLIDKNGIWYVGITPDASYNSVRLNVGFASGVNLLNVSRDMDVTVYNSFYYSTPSGTDCGTALFTTPGEVQGVSLNLGSATSLASLDSAISNPQLAIDADTSTYSKITSGVLGIATSVSQTIRFYGDGNASDMVTVKLSMPLSALTAAVLSNLTLTAYNGTTQVGSAQSVSALVSADVLGLLGDNTRFYMNMRPGSKFDRVKISLGNLVNIGSNILGGGIRIYDVKRIASAPSISGQPVNDTVCVGETAMFNTTATGSNLSYQWQSYQSSSWVNAGSSNPLNVTNAQYNMNGRKYRVLITGGYCSDATATVTSSEATLVVNPLPVTPSVQLSN